MGEAARSWVVERFDWEVLSAQAAALFETKRHRPCARGGGDMKTIAKALASGLASILVSPALLLYFLGCRTIGPERAFPGWSQAFALIPGWTGVYLRRAFYRRVLRRCEPGCCLSFGSVFSHPTAEIGKDVYVGTLLQPR